MKDVPNINDSSYSKALAHKIAEKDELNRTFYAFGAKHTNIRKHLRSSRHSFSAQNLDTNFRDIRIKTLHNDNSEMITKSPNVIMNDYTKNISHSIFTPGVFKQTNRITNLSR